MEENKSLQEVEREIPSPSEKKEEYMGEKPSKVRMAVLLVLGTLTLISGFVYYKLVVKYENISPKVIYKREEKLKEIVKENLTIYLPNEDNEGLIAQQAEIVTGETPEDRVENIFLEIKKNLDYDMVYSGDDGQIVELPFMKDEVQLLDVYIDGRDVYLNMNYHFRDNMKTISQEIFILYSIVNTLTEDGRYRRIKFLINNNEVEQLNFYKLSDFYERNLEI